MAKHVTVRRQDALQYHEQDPPGKIEVIPSKEVQSQKDLSLAYSPGVAEPCKEIAENPLDVYRYTAKGNLVAVVSNGTAVLGLGDIGPAASKPVMEGKGVLFKKFAGIDVYDIEIDESDPDSFVKIVKALEPTFGGINLEDIKAPECFEIETRLKEEMGIPVMHDDQHGTAIISAAALLNAAEVAGKDIAKMQVVINGAGAASITSARLYVTLGVKRENIVMLDSKGVISTSRDALPETKAEFATDRKVEDLEGALKGADMFLGLSVADVVTPDMLKKMAKNPIVFALANPDPEIAYELAVQTRDDVIMATGRSDHPNQVNNVLGFPYIFRGALDVRATSINEEMKLAAVQALAELAKEPVPEIVSKAYGDRTMGFGRNYLIPKPLDPRLITTVSLSVAHAAIDSGVARSKIEDWEAYREQLQHRIGSEIKLTNTIITRARKHQKRIVFAEADNYKTLKAAQAVADEGIGIPILLGNKKDIERLGKEYHLELPDCDIIDAFDDRKKQEQFGELLFEKRQRKGLTLLDCTKLMRDRNYFGAMMVETGEGDAVISGLTKDYSTALRPALQVLGVDPLYEKVAGMVIVSGPKGIFFFADTTVQVNPSAKDLVNIIGMASDAARSFNHEPRVAVLSYSNFGSVKGEVPSKTAEAVRLAKERYPDLDIDGEIQANIAVNSKLQQEVYGFSEIAETGANVLIFPDLASGNIAYKLMMELGGSMAIGPLLLGLKKPFHILQIGSSVRQIVNMAAIASIHAQILEKREGTQTSAEK